MLDCKTYRQLLDALEDLEDIPAADAALVSEPDDLPLDEPWADIEREQASMPGLSNHVTSIRDKPDSCGMLCMAKHAADHQESAMSLLELFYHVDTFCQTFVPHWERAQRSRGERQ
jgi:hypothetical protein